MMLTVEDVSERLKVHPQTVYRWIYDGKLKSLKIEGIVRITEEDYQDFIGKKPTLVD
jgi:excisionase family DNA binding protein